MGIIVAIYHDTTETRAVVVVEQYFVLADRHTLFDMPILSRRHGEKSYVIVYPQVRTSCSTSQALTSFRRMFSSTLTLNTIATTEAVPQAAAVNRGKSAKIPASHRRSSSTRTTGDMSSTCTHSTIPIWCAAYFQGRSRHLSRILRIVANSTTSALLACEPLVQQNGSRLQRNEPPQRMQQRCRARIPALPPILNGPSSDGGWTIQRAEKATVGQKVTLANLSCRVHCILPCMCRAENAQL